MIDFFSQPVFRGVAPESLALLSDDMVRYYRTGEYIVREEHNGRDLIVLLDGDVQVFSGGTFLVCRKAGEVIGEQAIIDRTARSATVIAQGMVKALLVPAYVLDQLMKDIAFVSNLENSALMFRPSWPAGCWPRALHMVMRDFSMLSYSSPTFDPLPKVVQE